MCDSPIFLPSDNANADGSSDCRRYAELHGDKHRDDADGVVYRPWHDIRSDQLALDALDRDDAGRGGSSKQEL